MNGNNLPWVTSSKHLGNKIENREIAMTRDLMEKRANYINRNNELMQEFHFAHPQTLIKVNNIFNTAFYGSTLWNLFGKEVERLEKTWNVSQRLMLGLHRKTHRFFIEPLSGTKHIIFSLYKRFINFTRQLAGSKKTSLRTLFNTVKNDCRSTTGVNLRNLMLRFNINTHREMNEDVINGTKYQDIPTGQEWKINIAKELLEVRNKKNVLPCFDTEEITILLQYITT